MANGNHLGDARSDSLIKALLDISNLVGSVMRLDDILNRIVRITADLMAMPACSIYLLDEKRQLVLRSTIGLDQELVGRMSFAPGEGIPGWVAKTGELLALPDAVRDPRFRAMGSTSETQYHAILCAPLRIQEEIIGAVTARTLEVRGFERQQVLLLETVCKMIAIVIEKARLYQRMIDARELAGVAISLSGTAHFIKNIMFTTQVAEATIDKAIGENMEIQQIRTSWGALKDSNQQISKLVGNMLSFVREEPPHYETIDLNRLIGELVDRFRPSVTRKTVHFATELDPGLGLVSLDPGDIRDVLLNLMTNAADAIPGDRPGTIWIRTRRIENQNNFRIEVADNGAGIPEEIRGRIFHLFFSTKGQGGSGIGLSSTRKIVEQHGGTVEFASTVGQGTCFTVFLPIVPPSALPGV